MLIFTIFMLAAEKHRATFLSPIGIGLALFIAELAGDNFTGGSCNPARSFGPDVVLGNFDHYHWIYWVGPFLGSIVAVLFYKFVKLLEYETANPGADHDGQPLPTHTIADPAPEITDPRVTTGQPHGVVHRTDGTDESEFALSTQPLEKPSDQKLKPRKDSSFAMNDVFGSTSLTSSPPHPLPAFPHGADGHRSSEWIDHPAERPRAHHTQKSRSQRSRSEMDNSEGRYRRGPSLESASSTTDPTTTSRASSAH